MKIILMYFLIFMISVVIGTLLNDKKKAINLLGKINIITSVAMSIILIIINIILKNSINFINISIFSDYLLKEYLKNILYLFIVGVLELIISKYLIKNKKL